jgi:hypothetical protein
MTKNRKKFKAQQKIHIFFIKKLQKIGLHTESTSTGKAFSRQKRTSRTLKHENSLLFSLFVGFAFLDPDPDPATQINADPDLQP